jgi:hypothetical protein
VPSDGGGVGLEESRREVLNMLVELHAGEMFSGRHGRNSVDGDMHGGYELGGDESEAGDGAAGEQRLASLSSAMQGWLPGRRRRRDGSAARTGTMGK